MKLTTKQINTKKHLLNSLMFITIGFGKEQQFVNLCRKTMSKDLVEKLEIILKDEVDKELFSDEYICGEAVKRMQKDMDSLFKILKIEKGEE